MTFKQKYYLRLILKIIICYKISVSLIVISIISICLFFIGDTTNFMMLSLSIFASTIVIPCILSINFLLVKNSYELNDLITSTLDTFSRMIYEDGFYYYFIYDRLIIKSFHKIGGDDNLKVAHFYGIHNLKEVMEYQVYNTKAQKRESKLNKLLK